MPAPAGWTRAPLRSLSPVFDRHLAARPRRAYHPGGGQHSMRHLPKSRLANVVGATLAIAGSVAVCLALVKRVREGRGLDHYIATSGQEWSALPALIFGVVATLILVVGSGLRWYFERREEHDFLRTVGDRIRRRRNARRSQDPSG